MLPEQQQRILGYFIEEAKDHLNTIEQGLLNLQSTLSDPEMVNEVFRAAHSIKGGAAMLGLSSIQRTAHRLEDCFKILKEHPIKVDQKLESLFLGVLDTLKALLEHLQRPFGLTEETANTLMSETEPVFTWLHEHLELLVKQGSAEDAARSTGSGEALSSQLALLTESERRQNVQAEVLQVLREMLQIFKQSATKETRQNLEQCCHKLAQLGEASHWSNWCSLCRACGSAIANPENTYLTLAKIVITDLKQGLELVLSGREAEIAVSQQLQALSCIEAEIELLEISFDLLDESANTTAGTSENSEQNIISPTFDVVESVDEGVAQIIEDDSLPIDSVEPQDRIASLTDLTYSFQGQFDTLPVILSSTDARGPEVGIAELNTLADLFEGESSDLDDTWDNEEVLDISNTSQPGIETSNSNNEDFDSEFEDLFFQEEISSREQQTKNTKQELSFGELFGDFIEEDNIEQKNQSTSNSINIDSTLTPNNATVVQPANIEKKQDEIGDLLEFVVDDNELLTLGDDTGLNTESQPNLELVTIQEPSFDDLFIDNANLSPIEEITPQPQVEEQKAALQKSENLVLDELFDEGEPESEVALSNHESISDELLDTLPGIDDSQLFWHQETEEIHNEIDSLIEEDAAQQLEKMLYAAAADEDIFDDSKQSPERISDNLNLEDLDINFQTEEQDFDFLFLSETDDDLFEELTLTDSTDLSAMRNGNISSHESSALLQQNSNRSQPGDTSTAPPPEGLELSPEFTHSSQETAQLNSAGDIHFLEIENNTALPNVSEDTQAMDLDNPFTLLPQETTETLFSEEITRDEITSQETPEFIDLATDLESLIDIQTETILQRSFADFDFTDNTDSANPLEINSELDFLVEESNEPEVVQSSQELQPVDDASKEINEEIPSEINEDNLATVVPLELEESILEESDILLNIQSSHLIEEDTENLLDIEESDFTDLSALFEGVESKNSASSVPIRQEESEEQAELLEIQESNFSDLFADVDAEEATASSGELVEQETQLLDTQAANLSELLAGLDLDDSSFIMGSTPPEITESTASQEELAQQIDVSFDDEFAELDKLLEQELASGLDALQQPQTEITAPKKLSDSAINPVTPAVAKGDMDFQLIQELEDMVKGDFPPRPPVSRTPRFEQLMKVPVKHLDDLSNLVGELVVNRNTLEQDQERMRQSLDNLLHQVQQLSDVGARMQELYERSLLEASLLASRKNSSSGFLHQSTDRGFTELEMDRFTPFHSLSQEMIELIVRVREAASDIDFVTEETERVARQFRQVSNQLQEGITRARMEPFSEVTTPLERGVRESAIKEGKQAQLKIEGRDTLIDKMILGHLKDPLTHLLNNAIAHGIEPTEVRQACGKSPVGNITVRAFHQGNQTVISVSDDGAGINAEGVKVKALKTGLITSEQARTISRVDVYDLLFQPGFSTAEKVDDLKGRGVGMDVVRTRISEIRGTISIDSSPGKGTTFTIRLPLTLSICKALCCVSDKARIAFPMDGVEDTLDIPGKAVQQGADGQKYIAWRETMLPFRPLKEILTFNRQLSRGNVYGGNRDDDMISVIVVRSANTLVALQVDQVLNEQEIVIKQFEGPAPKPIGVAGATVLGDGRIMPIADVLEIIDIFQGRTSKQRAISFREQTSTVVTAETSSAKIDPTVLIVDDSITVRELLSLTFNKAGYRVEQARDGQEAWDKLRSGLPCDIVFCDIEMPRCDGLELLSRIQKDSNLNNLPIAMLTSRGADKHRQMAIQLGASGYFTKPYLEEALLEAASRMLKGEKLVNNVGI